MFLAIAGAYALAVFGEHAGGDVERVADLGAVAGRGFTVDGFAHVGSPRMRRISSYGISVMVGPFVGGGGRSTKSRRRGMRWRRWWVGRSRCSSGVRSWPTGHPEYSLFHAASHGPTRRRTISVSVLRAVNPLAHSRASGRC
ncbi:hypothetical protein GS445_18010 [Rhodococcus hoagii]|nr:hypothetical protein [Prescottella equi]